jgi:DNA-binding LacI/PurR family transcriptional regulator
MTWEGNKTMSAAPARPTIYDVAQRAGVSKSLVSLVLRGSDRVSDHRRRAVEQAITDLGYRPSQAATALAASRTRSIGVVIDDFENLWFVDLLRGVRDVLNESGLHVSVADRHVNAHLDQDPVDGFLSRGVEGLVMAMEPGEASLRGVDVPLVVAGARTAVPPGVDLVANDDRVGAELATRHLLELGHVHVGHLTGLGGAAALRRSGYESTMRAAGLEPTVVGENAPTTERVGYDSMVRLLDRQPCVTAVFAANDTMALGALAALRERGLRVPVEFSVVGYDNAPLAASRLIDLTTVDDRSADVGATAARALLSRMAKPGRRAQRVFLAPALVRRGSTAPRKAS